MKNYAITALIALTASAIDLTEASSTTALQVSVHEKTVLGFVYEGADFGMLWLDLTDDQRTTLKDSIFQQVLKFNNLNPTEYKDNMFTFTEE